LDTGRPRKLQAFVRHVGQNNLRAGSIEQHGMHHPSRTSSDYDRQFARLDTDPIGRTNDAGQDLAPYRFLQWNVVAKRMKCFLRRFDDSSKATVQENANRGPVFAMIELAFSAWGTDPTFEVCVDEHASSYVEFPDFSSFVNNPSYNLMT
jgi:hypothetical protein